MFQAKSKLSNTIISAKATSSSGAIQNIPTGSEAVLPEAQVSVENDGDVVRVIYIRCACGSVTKIECVYD